LSWTNRLVNLFRGRQLFREIDEELQFHLDARTRDNIAAGMTPAEARRNAARRFGNRTLERERARDANILVWLESVAQDARFAGCMMRRHPTFTATAVLLLGLGIGASTGIFSLLMATIFQRDASYESSGRLVYFWRRDKAGGDFSTYMPYGDLMAVREHSRSLERLAVYRGGVWALNAPGGPEKERGYYVSSNWLSALDTQPALGRNFLPEEEQPGRGDVVILTDALWRRLFGANPNIIGSRFHIEERAFTVVGVLPARFDFNGAAMFAPLVADERTRASMRCYALANLRGGVSLAQGQTEMDAVVQGIERRGPTDRGTWGIQLAAPPMHRAYQCGPTCEQQHRGIWLLFAAVGMVMLMACANVANLLLARAMGRQREFQIRAAIGCSRTRLARQILTENMLLFLLGGIVGIGIAAWMNTLLARYATGYTGAKEVPLDGRVLLFTAAATFLTGIVFGMIPALRPAPSLAKDADLHRTRARGFLVASEFALALTLLIGLGLLLRSFLSVESIPLGFRATNLLTADTSLHSERYRDPAQRIALARRLLENVQALPGVQSAAMTSDLPLTGAGATRIRIEEAAPSDSRGEPVRYITASPELFKTLEIPLIEGRRLSEHDSGATAPVAVINQTMARIFFRNGSAVGRRIQMEDEPLQWREIVGVVGDVRQRNLEEDSRPVFYRPYAQGMDQDLSLAVRVRSEADMQPVALALRKALRESDPRQPWNELKSMRRLIDDSESLTLRRPVVGLLGCFGLLAVILATAGLYAVLSYSVTERTREIGIRMALGAQRAQVLRQIARDTARMAAAGAIIGAAAAYQLSSLLPSGHIGWSGSGVFLYGVTRMDAPTYLAVVLVLGCVSMVATLLPARRAMRVDPAAALRHE
jgi:predicted permease